jgi:hypothetical protein
MVTAKRLTPGCRHETGFGSLDTASRRGFCCSTRVLQLDPMPLLDADSAVRGDPAASCEPRYSVRVPDLDVKLQLGQLNRTVVASISYRGSGTRPS